jgi:integrase
MPSITKRKRDKSAIRTARIDTEQSRYPYLALRQPRRAGGQARYVIFHLDANGRRQEIGTGAFDGQLELAQKAFDSFKAKSRAPAAFGDGKPNQVLITDVLSYYASRKIGSDNSDAVVRADTATAALKNLGEFFAPYTVAELTPDLAQDYVQWRIRLGDRRGSNKWKKREATPRLLKPSTAWNDVRFLNASLYKAWENKKLTHQICVTLPTEAFSDKRERALTVNESARLVLAALGWDFRTGKRDYGVTANGHPCINRPLARFILAGIRTGTRKERSLRLQWVQNFQGGWIDLDKGILHRKAPTEKDTTKRAPSMALPRGLWSMMRRWRTLSTRFVFEQSGGRPFKDLDTAFANACIRAGLSVDRDDPTKVTPHTLRHTCVTQMLDRGMTCWEAGQAVGMTAQMVELRYGHGSLAQQRAALERVDGRAPNVLSHSRLTEMRKRG